MSLYKIDLKDKRKLFHELTFVEQEGSRFIRGTEMALQNSNYSAKFKAPFYKSTFLAAN